MTDTQDGAIAERFRQSLLYRALDEAERRKVEASIDVRRFAPGDEILREADEGRDLYVLDSGTVRVSRATADGELELRELGPGALVGEYGAATGAPRSSTVTAVTEVVAVLLPSRAVKTLVEGNPKVRDLLAKLIAGRSRHSKSLLPGEPT
jgi:CRP/FNR family transcriptional regulator